jgi:hypothetical protein|tara:strand:+ start:714 stop:953 length:240 start_codon:yes stop_codon:yes gene_type:complete
MNNYLRDKMAPGVKLQLGTNSYGYPSGGLPLKNGGWIQEATKGMRKDKPCTGKKFGSKTCPKGSRRYNLAKTFKKMAKS